MLSETQYLLASGRLKLNSDYIKAEQFFLKYLQKQPDPSKAVQIIKHLKERGLNKKLIDKILAIFNKKIQQLGSQRKKGKQILEDSVTVIMVEYCLARFYEGTLTSSYQLSVIQQLVQLFLKTQKQHQIQRIIDKSGGQLYCHFYYILGNLYEILKNRPQAQQSYHKINLKPSYMHYNYTKWYKGELTQANDIKQIKSQIQKRIVNNREILSQQQKSDLECDYVYLCMDLANFDQSGAKKHLADAKEFWHMNFRIYYLKREFDQRIKKQKGNRSSSRNIEEQEPSLLTEQSFIENILDPPKIKQKEQQQKAKTDNNKCCICQLI